MQHDFYFGYHRPEFSYATANINRGTNECIIAIFKNLFLNQIMKMFKLTVFHQNILFKSKFLNRGILKKAETNYY